MVSRNKQFQFCRICRTEKNLKFTVKELREFNRVQGAATGNDKASQKLLRTTPTLGNICKDCDDRVQIFHRLDEATTSCDSDIEIDVDDTATIPLPAPPNLPTLNTCRPDTPIIVDDDEMLYDLFMQKVDQQRQQRQITTQIQEAERPELHAETQQTFINHFNPQYTPPQSTGGSEGDDAKMLDDLTSREGTPASIANAVTPVPLAPQLPPAIVDNKGHRIVAIIDLDDGDEDSCPAQSDKIDESMQNTIQDKSPNMANDIVVAQAILQTDSISESQQTLLTTNNIIETPALAKNVADVSDDEEIVFRQVEPHLETPLSKKKRKSYDEKKLRLVASLSLVSSDDSEPEEPVAKQPKVNAAPTDLPKCFNCKECQISLPDAESLSVHARVHEGIKCPECQYTFPLEKRLINHMRRKHRAYNGKVLKEKSRGPQDSAMTIRLRYMQSQTYYECQLCGRIDEIYKEHKDHILNKHPMESKTLKDPIMKELKCPVCKEKCGCQYIRLCRHILENHDYAQHKTHLREIVHVSAFGWNAARQKEVAKTARIFQFSKRTTFFFQCKKCYKVVAGYLNHLKHITQSCKIEEKSKSVEKKIRPPAEKLKPKKKPKVEKIAKTLDSTKKKKQVIQKDLKSCKKTPKPSKKSLNLEKPLVSKNSPNVTKKSNKEDVKAIAKPIVSKTKADAIKPLPQTKPSEKSKKRKRKEESVSQILKPQKKVVKVKAPVKQIPTQSFNCGHCPIQIKGFLLYSKHIWQEHVSHEFVHCDKCSKTTLFKYHNGKCSNLATQIKKQKRKCVTTSGGGGCNGGVNSSTSTKDTDVNCDLENAKECQQLQQIVPESLEDSQNLPATNGEIAQEQTPMWLKDLCRLNELRNNMVSSDDNEKSSIAVININDVDDLYPAINRAGVQQCCYCLHLFSSELELKNHTRLQHTGYEEILVRYTPINVTI
uniref:C2H2-type domain-containing protein n=1 Tax=Stomoxys calcitrans TaxID=35570 RepID=A0A1I8PTB4_STOCA